MASALSALRALLARARRHVTSPGPRTSVLPTMKINPSITSQLPRDSLGKLVSHCFAFASSNAPRSATRRDDLPSGAVKNRGHESMGSTPLLLQPGITRAAPPSRQIQSA